MCSISLPANLPPGTLGDTPVKTLSIYKEGWEEACRYKWILSERERRDMGESAIRQWVREHWNGFLRARWVEHLYGRCFWVELDQNDFGLLTREFRDSGLLRPILDQLIQRKENLDVIDWAHKQVRKGRLCSMDEVLEILEALDINSRRLEFQVENQLAQTDPR
jgi:hypothetical protein